MNRRSLSSVNAFMTMAMGASEMSAQINDFIEPIVYIDRDPIPPAGCKTYWFDSTGRFSSESMRRSEVVFSCFAINDGNAKRKYERWKSAR